MSDETGNADSPLDSPEAPDTVRERVRRVAEIRAACGDALADDDLEAALNLFAAARAEQVDPMDLDALRAQRAAATLDFSRFRARRVRQRLLHLLDRLVAAIEQRDVPAAWEVLEGADACRCFPAAVREEALSIARLPTTSLRPPTQLYRYYHTLLQLGDEPMERDTDLEQFAISPATPPSEATREIAFPDRHPPRGGPRNGGDKRRSGSR